MKGPMIHSGDLHAPEYIGVCDAKNNLAKIHRSCIGLCLRMGDQFEERDIATVCISKTAGDVKRNGIQIWV